MKLLTLLSLVIQINAFAGTTADTCEKRANGIWDAESTTCLHSKAEIKCYDNGGYWTAESMFCELPQDELRK